MIFSSFGHPIDQKKIVVANFSSLQCAPAGSTLRMALNLSGSWVDDNGVPFQSTVTTAYDPANNVNSNNNVILVNELLNNRPLLYANRTHAMVVVSFDYIDGPAGPGPLAVGVLDPWPYSPDFHLLNPREMIPVTSGGDMTFLASVDVS
jgi:hypothetical protein